MGPGPPDDLSSVPVFEPGKLEALPDAAGGDRATSTGRTADAAGEADCRTCAMRSRCISYGWMSPGGLWFENAVVLRPRPGCRGFVGRSDDIRAHFRSSLPPRDH